MGNLCPLSGLFLVRRLQADRAEEELSTFSLGTDLPVLWAFRDILTGVGFWLGGAKNPFIIRVAESLEGTTRKALVEAAPDPDAMPAILKTAPVGTQNVIFSSSLHPTFAI